MFLNESSSLPSSPATPRLPCLPGRRRSEDAHPFYRTPRCPGRSQVCLQSVVVGVWEATAVVMVAEVVVVVVVVVAVVVIVVVPGVSHRNGAPPPLKGTTTGV
ncbi:hypothetical protein E2C01_073609 [Portunus trituberculatus]|uniref:Uncharacterized protein n=1 Tax=Portunus trituberculatus TaxID=210409 RepID=A0A5B7IB15_PORTR|nr:hypothetical protein [Portunus trituberculatus]